MSFEGGQRHLAAFQRVADAGDQQPVFDRVEPLGAFGMAGAHVVLPAIGVREITGFVHRLTLVQT